MEPENETQNQHLRQPLVSGSINLSEFKDQIVSKVKEINSYLKGYKNNYEGLTVLFSQEEHKTPSYDIVKGGLLVEFSEKPILKAQLS